MPATILHISGPPGSGKTTLARVIAARLHSEKPHYIRLHLTDGHTAPALHGSSHFDEMASQTQHWVESKKVFEEVSAILKTVSRTHHPCTIFLETDTQPCFRHAYPYHVNVFVMRPPHELSTVFRTPFETAEAVEKAMDDTTEFAAELFGLDRSPLDSAVLPSVDAKDRKSTSEPAQTAEEFLNSQVGMEIVSRMRLQPDYQSMIDSDVIFFIITKKLSSPLTELCSHRIDSLLDKLRNRLGRQICFSACNPLLTHDLHAQRGLRTIETLLQTERAAS